MRAREQTSRRPVEPAAAACIASARAQSRVAECVAERVAFGRSTLGATACVRPGRNVRGGFMGGSLDLELNKSADSSGPRTRMHIETVASRHHVGAPPTILTHQPTDIMSVRRGRTFHDQY
eukprot:359736-Chlamydomonas_euryale.AAC.5